MRRLHLALILLILISIFPQLVNSQISCSLVNPGNPEIERCENTPNCYVGTASGGKVSLCDLPGNTIQTEFTIQTDPAADVYLDDAFKGTMATSPISIPTTDGEHVLMIQKRGYKTLTQTINAVGGKIIKINAPLTPADTGTYNLKINTIGAEVMLDGVLVGKTSASRSTISISITAGEEHRLTVKKVGYASFSQLIKIVTGDTADLEINLVRTMLGLRGFDCELYADCSSGLQCDTLKKKCLSIEGATCVKDQDCLSGLVCRTTPPTSKIKKCLPPSLPLAIGEICFATEYCSQGLECEQNKCVDKGVKKDSLDSDKDGIPDETDPDDDNDGILDGEEALQKTEDKTDINDIPINLKLIESRLGNPELVKEGSTARADGRSGDKITLTTPNDLEKDISKSNLETECLSSLCSISVKEIDKLPAEISVVGSGKDRKINEEFLNETLGLISGIKLLCEGELGPTTITFSIDAEAAKDRDLRCSDLKVSRIKDDGAAGDILNMGCKKNSDKSLDISVEFIGCSYFALWSDEQAQETLNEFQEEPSLLNRIYLYYLGGLILLLIIVVIVLVKKKRTPIKSSKK